MALFITVAGLTGAALAYREPLEALTAPSFHHAPGMGAVLDPLELRARAERAAGVPVDFLPLRPQAGRALVLAVDGAGFDEIALDPVTGTELGRRQWGDILQGSVNLMPFLYRLHYSLAAGDAGSLLMGIVALVWTLDCFVGFTLTLPRGRQRWWPRWRKAFGVSTASAPRLAYDGHRASGLWLWPVLLLFAWSSVGFNLPQAFSPLMGVALGAERAPERQPPIIGPVDWAAARERSAMALARVAAREGLTGVQAEWLRLNRGDGQWIVGFRSNRDLATAYPGGRLTLDAGGRELALHLPTGQSTRGTVESLIFGLHMGGVLGPVWRAALVPIGIGIAGLSLTGVLIWWRKRRAAAARRQTPRALPKSQPAPVGLNA
jgi:uncharacterized iron-regulated membrane protein